MGQYLPVLTLGILGVVFVIGSLMTSRLLAPSRPNAAKSAPYESGITQQVAMPRRFGVGFYLVAMIFIMFDIEIVFLYPWAVANKELGLFGFFAMALFVVIFFLSFVYELSTGGLNWGPGRRTLDESVQSSDRTTSSTIRRVGLEGRGDYS